MRYLTHYLKSCDFTLEAVYEFAEAALAIIGEVQEDNEVESSSSSSSSNNIIPLTLTAEEANSTVTLEAHGSPNTSGLMYSTDSTTWKTYTCGTAVTLAEVGNYVQFKNTADTLSVELSKYVQFSMTGKIAASGNIQSMVNYREDCPTYCYHSMFQDCTSLTSAPLLPATTLAGGCYYRMFRGCTSLTSAPLLPATTLNTSCYSSMFSGCTSLTEAPLLSAESLSAGCYQYMFLDCTSLTSVPLLPATTLYTDCYLGMFQGCTYLITAPLLPATTLVYGCYQYMFQGCSNLNSIKVGFTLWHGNATNNWVDGVAATGTFTKPADLALEYSVNRIPEGWTYTT